MPNTHEADFTIILPPTTFMNQYPETDTFQWDSNSKILVGEITSFDFKEKYHHGDKSISVITKDVPCYIFPPGDDPKNPDCTTWRPFNTSVGEMRKHANALSLRGFFDDAVGLLRHIENLENSMDAVPHQDTPII